jgi:hypothetical protein
MPVSGAAYGALPASHTYKGFDFNNLNSKTFAGILVRVQ